jgi:hypothetical protein
VKHQPFGNPGCVRKIVGVTQKPDQISKPEDASGHVGLALDLGFLSARPMMKPEQ